VSWPRCSKANEVAFHVERSAWAAVQIKAMLGDDIDLGGIAVRAS